MQIKVQNSVTVGSARCTCIPSLPKFLDNLQLLLLRLVFVDQIVQQSLAFRTNAGGLRATMREGRWWQNMCLLLLLLCLL